MRKFAMVVFPDEKSAYEGLHALQQLHAEGTLTVYGTDIVHRDAGGLRVLMRNDDDPRGLGLGALIGGLVGLFGGPVGAVLGVAVGSAAGGLRDIFHMDVSDEFLESVERTLSPGKFGVVAEISEEWVAPLELRMAELGGKVIREDSDVFTEELLDRRMNTVRNALAERKAERARAKAERAAARAGKKAEWKERSLEIEIDDARFKLTSMAEKAEKRLDGMEKELNAKLAALQAQVAGANPEVRNHVEQRIAEIRREYTDRKQKLTTARGLAREALRL